MANTRNISQEELWMIEYFKELQEAGFIKEIIYQPEPIILSNTVLIKFEKKLKTKSKFEDKTLISKHVYTPDFLITWNSDKFHKNLYEQSYFEWPLFFSTMNRCFVEVKANRDMQNMTRHFTSAIQPWIYQQYDIYVNLVKVPNIFKDTFLPKNIRDEFFYKVNTKKNKKGDKKFNWEYRSLEQYLKII